MGWLQEKSQWQWSNGREHESKEESKPAVKFSLEKKPGSMPKPNSSAFSSNPNEPMNQPRDLKRKAEDTSPNMPLSLKDFVTRAFARCVSDEERNRVENRLRETINQVEDTMCILIIQSVSLFSG
eukprot:m.314350 g.314350  ORF g.314350 m.314350 type:complete len:125 (+) comp16493_c0_seq66:176-550(+)